MPRYFLTIEYDGTPFVGWQTQENGPSVQDALERAVKGFSGEDTKAVAAGRTDTGVHALGMVIHIDLSKEYPLDTIRDALNYHLKPNPIAVILVQAVPDDLHARFSCLRRHYLYRLQSRRAPFVLHLKRSWRRNYPLDIDAMRKGAAHLIGHHDFTTFRSTHCQGLSPVKTVDEITIEKVDDEIHLRCVAKSFLHNQVRSFVGTLEMVGAGKWAPDRVKEALEARNRAACGPVAPAHGLYFQQADYPADKIN